MKKLLLSLLAVVVCFGSVIAAPQPKSKTFKLADNATYNGMALKKTPQGEGFISLESCGTISGYFEGNEISNGKIEFNDHKFVVKGDFTMQITSKKNPYDGALTDLFDSFSKSKNVVITIKKGYVGKRRIIDEATFIFCEGNYALEYQYVATPKLPKDLTESIKAFAGNVKYKRYNNGRNKCLVHNTKVTREVVKKPTKVTYKFENGTEAVLKLDGGASSLTRTNGDYISFTINNNEYLVSGYKVSGGNSMVEKGKITHVFENGHKYVGFTNNDKINAYANATTLDQLIGFSGINWQWSNFKKYAHNGFIVYSNGVSERVINGLTESEIRAIEEERRRMRANDQLYVDNDGKVIGCTITFREGVVFHYSAETGDCYFDYNNGNKMGFYDPENFSNAKYEELLADLDAPKITDWNYNASFRKFANGYEFFNHDKHLAVFGKNADSYIFYNFVDGEFVPDAWKLEIDGAVSYGQYYKSARNGESTKVEHVRFRDGSVLFAESTGEQGIFGYNRNANNSVQSNPVIRALGITVVCGMEDVYVRAPYNGLVFNSSGELTKIYYEGVEMSKDIIYSQVSKEQLNQMIKPVHRELFYEYAVKKYPQYKQHITTFCEAYYGFVQGTPIGFVRDVIKVIVDLGGKKSEKVSGGIRTISLSAPRTTGGYAVFAEIQFNEATGELIDYTWTHMWNDWYYEEGYLDSINISDLIHYTFE